VVLHGSGIQAFVSIYEQVREALGWLIFGDIAGYPHDSFLVYRIAVSIDIILIYVILHFFISMM